jgi:hypothetical protein
MTRRMAAFLLSLVLPHLAQATTCQGHDYPNGVIITGGATARARRGDPVTRSIETLPTETTFTIPPFPAPGRTFHTLSVVENGRQLVACGGIEADTRRSCISWRRGQDEWTHYATLSQERYNHAEVSINNKIILVGGKSRRSDIIRSGEIVNEGGSLFTLRNDGMATCAVPHWALSGFFTIGGAGKRGPHGKVDRYDSEGKYLDSLPDLATPRYNHACTSLISNGERVLLVAGGSDNNNDELASTEIFSNGRWRRVGNLPRALSGLRAAHLNQQVVFIGGQDDDNNIRDEVLQYNPSTKTWRQKTGSLKNGRRDHAVTIVNLDALGCVGLNHMVEGDYVQSSPPPSNDWHYVSIRAQSGSENLFSWKNKAGVEWDLIFVEEESSGVFKFQVGENCPYYTDGYTEARLFTNNAIEIEGPGGIYTKQTSGSTG